MKKELKRILSFCLVISIIITSSVAVNAATEELYLSDLRIIYANNYDEAEEIISGTEFNDYKILNENLNKDSGKIGVWLAYKSSTDIEEAITDISTIQMSGGYKQGNYQKMIEESYNEYVEMGEIYLKAIEYFVNAYDNGHFLSESAYRQLNFYNVVSEGVKKSKIPSFEGELLGDIFYNGISEFELATMFFEGNSYALQNIRSLLAMGVSYNEDGKTYLDKVEEAASKMNADKNVFNDSDFDGLALLIAPSLTVIKGVLKELASYEADFNYNDDDFSDEELKYAEHKAIADMLRDVDYLDGKTLYQFCLDYEQNKDDYSNLYPLAAALNDGQVAMTKVAHYYDVLRYSMTNYPEELINSELDKMEELYSENPFNVYTGVDRTIYDGTFALTNDAYRSDVYGEGGLSDALFGGDRWKYTAGNIAVGATGVGIWVWAIVERGTENSAPAFVAATKATNALKTAVENLAKQKFVAASGGTIYMNMPTGSVPIDTYGDMINLLLIKNEIIPSYTLGTYTMYDRYHLLMSHASKLPRVDNVPINTLTARIRESTGGEYTTYDAYQATVEAGKSVSHVTSTALFIIGGVMMLASAFNIGRTVYNYYHPDYEDIPVALVDMKDTVDGDRYIKYDAVFEAETNKDGIYEAADLNAYAGMRWNALYYTKSYEAGKPLLADEFVVSSSNNKAKDGYTPIHRFGEEVCYDLNKYNFNEKSPSIYLSVKQSKNDKSAVADVPEVVGSIFSNGLWLLVGGIGGLVGVGGTLGTQFLLKKKTKGNKKTKKSED